MKNLTLSKRFSSQHDNGERILYWVDINNRIPPKDDKYLVTLSIDYGDGKTGYVVREAYYENPEGDNKDTCRFFIDAEFDQIDINDQVIAWMKYPSCFKRG